MFRRPSSPWPLHTTEAAVPHDAKVSGVVLADQVKSQGWRARRADFICKLPDEELADVLAKLAAQLN